MPLRRRIVGGWLLAGIAFFAVSWFALSGANRLLASFDGPAVFRLFPEPAIWILFPCIGSLTLSWELDLRIWAFLSGRDTVDLFSEWSSNDSTFWGPSRFPQVDYRRVFRWMAFMLAFPAGAAVLLALNMHASVGPDEIRDCGYAFRLCKIYSLADARHITEIQGFRDKSGKLIDRAGLVVEFKDGRRWSSAVWGEWMQSADPALSTFLKQKTGLPLNFAETENDIPSLSIQSPSN
jgi:hypothetical protein